MAPEDPESDPGQAADAVEVPNPDAEAARERVVDALGRASAEYGLDPLVGRVYGHLYFAPDTRPPSALAGHLDADREAVEDALATLERWHLVTRSPAGAVARRDFGAALSDLLENEVEAEARIVGDALADAEATLEDATGARAEADLERVRHLRHASETAYAVASALQAMPSGRVADLVERVVGRDLPRGPDGSLPATGAATGGTEPEREE